MKILSTTVVAAMLLPTPSLAQLQASTRLGRVLRSDGATGEDARALFEDADSAFDSLSLSIAGIDKVASSKSGKAPSASSSKSGKGAKGDIPTLNLYEPHQPLKISKQITAEGNFKYGEQRTVKATIRMGVAKYVGPKFTTLARVYNGDIPGPTIHVMPGDKLEIELINDLEYPLGNDVMNQWRLPNTTNLHTHGMHISGERPGDSIYISVGPQESNLYRYEIGTDLMPGTMWYHPHLHGATALQTYTSIGQLIIDDPKHYPIPQVVKDMPEIQLTFVEVNLVDLENVTETSGDLLSNIVVTNVSTTDEYFFAVNGQYQPVVTIEKNVWYRLRMLLSAVEKSLVMELAQGNDCEMGLIAKDGIYLNVAPRMVETLFFSPGNRADIALRCGSVGQVKMVKIADGAQDFDPDFDGPDVVGISGAEPPPTFVHCTAAQAGDNSNCPEVLLINVIDGNSAPVALEEFSVTHRPCYLADLRGVEPDVFDTVHLQFPPYLQEEGFCPNGSGVMGVNNMPFMDMEDVNTFEYQLGVVVETTTFPNGAHPYHQHINPFQLIELPVEGVPGSIPVSAATQIWYQIGDWHDVIQYPRLLMNTSYYEGTDPGDLCVNATPPSFWEGGVFYDDDNFRKTKFRWAANQFTGSMIFHCHRLLHEDVGMMGQFGMLGKEGTLWDGARDVDPTCVLPGEYPGKPKY